MGKEKDVASTTKSRLCPIVVQIFYHWGAASVREKGGQNGGTHASPCVTHMPHSLEVHGCVAAYTPMRCAHAASCAARSRAPPAAASPAVVPRPHTLPASVFHHPPSKMLSLLGAARAACGRPAPVLARLRSRVSAKGPSQSQKEKKAAKELARANRIVPPALDQPAVLDKFVRSAADLEAAALPPFVYVFRNMASGQCVYTQTPLVEEHHLIEQFTRPNWQNRRPLLRRDLWRIMCVAEFPLHADAVDVYGGLVELRRRRDVTHKTEARKLRVLNKDGNVWYSSQYRPAYTQEACADLLTVVDEFALGGTVVHWEDMWRRGAENHWSPDLVEHRQLNRWVVRQQGEVLRRLGDEWSAASQPAEQSPETSS